MRDHCHMTTAAQALSNQSNAQFSTGPRSEAGKLRSARNAPTRHGLTATKFLLLPSEDAAELRAFADELRNDLAPDGAFEVVLVDRIISAAWRLRRVGVYENGVLQGEGADENLGLAFFRDARKGDAMAKVGRYVRECETSLRVNRNLLTLEQARRSGQSVPLPATVDLVVTTTEAVDQSE